MNDYFNKLNDFLFSLLSDNEIIKVGLWGESSQFIRFNNSKIRQTGIVDDMSYSICLIHNLSLEKTGPQHKQHSCKSAKNRFFQVLQ